MNDDRIKKVSVTAVLFSMLFAFGVAAYYNGSQLINRVPIMNMISHTEYGAGQEGQIITRLVDYQDEPVTVNWCKVWISYPDKSLFVDADLMIDDSGNFTGNHYYNFTIPSTYGVYEYNSQCNFNKTPSISMTKTVSNSFHVNPALDAIYLVNSTLYAQAEANYNNIQTNLTNIYSDTQWLVDNVATNDVLAGNFTAVQSRFDAVDSNLSVIKDYCSTSDTSNSQLCQWVSAINDRTTYLNDTFVAASYAYYNEINATAHSIYDYMTGTLASNVNNIWTTLVDTQATVNATYALAQAVNSTTTTILTNQQDDYRMSVSTG